MRLSDEVSTRDSHDPVSSPHTFVLSSKTPYLPELSQEGGDLVPIRHKELGTFQPTNEQQHTSPGDGLKIVT